ncbi:hypothetical protein H8E88_19685 [candidate division KSB1 bacterium]|nr:hypothetical protein [candidate division KSB1 bacterium]
MRHPSFIKWDKKLKKVMNDLDDFLEENYGDEFKLHPVRQKRGETSNKAQDGLFNIVANFSLGIGTEFGRGYVVDIHLSTLDKIQEERTNEIKNKALKRLKEKLPVFFPGKNLYVDLDKNLIKIHGDLSLGEV